MAKASVEGTTTTTTHRWSRASVALRRGRFGESTTTGRPPSLYLPDRHLLGGRAQSQRFRSSLGRRAAKAAKVIRRGILSGEAA